MTEIPQYTHDCDKCQFLGRYTCAQYNECDLYYCKQGGTRDTVIARFGNDGPQYISGLPFVGQVPAITEAHRRWREQFACKVCGNYPNEDGELDHGRGCYTQSEDGGGTEYVDLGEK